MIQYVNTDSQGFLLHTGQMQVIYEMKNGKVKELKRFSSFCDNMDADEQNHVSGAIIDAITNTEWT